MSNYKLLVGQTALVTGCNRGIGREIASLFAEQGANVVVNARAEGSVDELCNQLSHNFDVSVTPMYFDVSSDSAIKKAFINVKKNHERLDILVNNAGVLKGALIGMSSNDQIDLITSTNLKSVIYCCRYASRLMSKQESGTIINMSSIVGRYGSAGQSVYAASKAGVIGLTSSLAKELAPHNIRVNAIAPGFINTDMTKDIPKVKHDEIVGNIRMQRLGEARDVANTALFLASDLSEYVTGQVIGVDGGLTI